MDSLTTEKLKTNAWQAIAIIVSIILFHLINNFIWVRMDHSYLTVDSHHHFMLSVRIFRMMQDHVLPTITALMRESNDLRWHGLLVAYMTAPFYYLLGASQDAGVMINNCIFIPVLLFSVFGIGSIIKNRSTGLWAAFIIGMYPLIFTQERIYMLDLPLTATVSLSVFLLLKSDFFRDKLYTVLFSLSCAAGMLIKVNFIGFLLPILIIYVLPTAVKMKRQISWKHIGIGIGTVLMIAAPFYHLKFFEISHRLFECSWLNPKFSLPHDSLFSLLSYWFYTNLKFLAWCAWSLINDGVSFILFLPFVASLFIVRRTRGYAHIFLLYVWLIMPLFLLSVFFHSTAIDRYLMPLLPPCALFTALGIERLSRNKLLRIGVALFAFISVAQYFAISYAVPFLRRPLVIRTPVTLPVPPHTSISFNSLSLWAPYRQYPFRNGDPQRGAAPGAPYWPTEELANRIVPAAAGTTLFFAEPLVELYNPLEYKFFLNRLPLSLSICPLHEELFYQPSRTKRFKTLLNAADYIILCEAGAVPPLEGASSLSSLIITTPEFREELEKFTVIDHLQLPDKRKLLLYQRKNNFVAVGTEKLKLYFRDGIMKIVLNDTPLTRYPGITSIVTWQSKEYISTEAHWEILQISPTGLEARVRWDGVPLYQLWKITVSGDDTVKITVILTSDQPVPLTRSYLDCTVTPSYTISPELPSQRVTTGPFTYSYQFPPGTPSLPLVPFRKTLPEITISTESAFDAFLPVFTFTQTSRIAAFTLKSSPTPQKVVSPSVSYPTSITLHISERGTHR